MKKKMIFIGTLLFVIIVFGITFGFFEVSVTQAAVFVVDDTAYDGDPGSLRDAIDQANATVEQDTIRLRPGRYVLELGQLEIQQDLLIFGSGARRTIIDGNRKSRVLYIGSKANVRIEMVRITKGTGDGLPETGSGGGINNDGYLTLVHTVVIGNEINSSNTVYGGGIYNCASLTLECSYVQNNKINTTSWAIGGGIHNCGDLIIKNGSNGGQSKVTGNSANGSVAHGGGICNEHRITLTKTIVSGNTVNANTIADGGGIKNYWGHITLASCLVIGNKAYGTTVHGGGINSEGDDYPEFTLNRSKVIFNTADGQDALGGGIYCEGSGSLSLKNRCQVNWNKANGTMTEQGGGIWVDSVANYTKSRNSRIRMNLPDNVFRP